MLFIYAWLTEKHTLANQTRIPPCCFRVKKTGGDQMHKTVMQIYIYIYGFVRKKRGHCLPCIGISWHPYHFSLWEGHFQAFRWVSREAVVTFGHGLAAGGDHPRCHDLPAGRPPPIPMCQKPGRNSWDISGS